MKLLKYVDLVKKYNALQNDYEVLLQAVKDEVFNDMIKNLNDEVQFKKLKTENKNLREKIKTLKEIIKNGE